MPLTAARSTGKWGLLMNSGPYRADVDWAGAGVGRVFPTEAEAREWAEGKARRHPDATIAVEALESDAIRAAGMGAAGILGEME